MKKERFNRTVDYLRQNGKANLAELAKINGVSTDTVRRDLEKLEEKGLLRRVRGGAVICDDDSRQKSFGIRSVLHHDEKIELCGALKEIIKEGQTVALNNGTTNIEAAKFLCKNFERLTVITNSLEVVSYLLEQHKFNVILPGGIVDLTEKSVYGSHCEADIENYNINVALLAVNAISLKKGITDFRFTEIGIIRAMEKASEKSYVLADSSKFETVSCANVCGLDRISGFLTDRSLSTELIDKYRDNNCKIYIS